MAQNFALFFPFPATIFFLSSLGVLPLNFWWCLKRRGPQMCTFGVLGLSCEVLGGQEATGASHNSPRDVHISGSLTCKHTTNIQRKNFEERERKERNFGRSGGGRSPPFRGPTHRAPLFLFAHPRKTGAWGGGGFLA